MTAIETYWLHWRISKRVGEQSFYEVCNDDGAVKRFLNHDDAISWLENSGETYHDTTEVNND